MLADGVILTTTRGDSHFFNRIGQKRSLTSRSNRSTALRLCQTTKAAQGAAGQKSMHISKLTLVNYRNFKNTTLQFHKGVNTIIGENGSGKSNILRAIRLLLDDTMVRAAYRLDESDFSRSLGQWQAIDHHQHGIRGDQHRRISAGTVPTRHCHAGRYATSQGDL